MALTTALVSHAAYADKEEQPPSDQAAQAQPEEREIEIAKISGEATVKKVDKKNRTLMIMDDQGKPHTVKVPASVKRFDAIQAGDKIKIDYYESVGLALEPKGEGKPGESDMAMMGKKAGKLPGGMAVRTMTASAQVLDVDHQANTLTLKGPEGNIDTLHVTDPEEQADLQKVKKGDTIRVRFTEALAISVERAPKAG
ncbi:MAG: hypothetical protein SFX73_08000 [Kofleriaceae bacterium]|nr:hypothetical protein [Kofleriaceae bacterium]